MDSSKDTLEHRNKVKDFMAEFCSNLLDRAEAHDESKLHEPEKSQFDKVSEAHPLASSEYGSAEYKAGKAMLGPALEHHYQVNDHHPQHFPNGVAGMNLYQLVEMYVDWHASSTRNPNGSIVNSVQHNIGEFKIDPQLASILMNTAQLDESGEGETTNGDNKKQAD